MTWELSLISIRFKSEFNDPSVLIYAAAISVISLLRAVPVPVPRVHASAPNGGRLIRSVRNLLSKFPVLYSKRDDVTHDITGSLGPVSDRKDLLKKNQARMMVFGSMRAGCFEL